MWLGRLEKVRRHGGGPESGRVLEVLESLGQHYEAEHLLGLPSFYRENCWGLQGGRKTCQGGGGTRVGWSHRLPKRGFGPEDRSGHLLHQLDGCLYSGLGVFERYLRYVLPELLQGESS